MEPDPYLSFFLLKFYSQFGRFIVRVGIGTLCNAVSPAAPQIPLCQEDARIKPTIINLIHTGLYHIYGTLGYLGHLLGCLILGRQNLHFYVLLPYIIYVMQSRRSSQCPALFSRTAKQRDKKYIVKSPERYKM
jgi:hypothetical protein